MYCWLSVSNPNYLGWLYLAALGTAWEGRLGNPSPPSDYNARGTSPLHTCRAGVSFLLLTPTLLALRGWVFFAKLLFKPGQCNALFHRAAQGVICRRKWEAADLGRGGHGQMDGCHPPSLREKPKPLTHHFLASKPAFDLEFVIYHHHHHGEREEAQQAISWRGGKKPLFLNVAFLHCFEGLVSLERCMCQEHDFPH